MPPSIPKAPGRRIPLVRYMCHTMYVPHEYGECSARTPFTPGHALVRHRRAYCTRSTTRQMVHGKAETLSAFTWFGGFTFSGGGIYFWGGFYCVRGVFTWELGEGATTRSIAKILQKPFIWAFQAVHWLLLLPKWSTRWSPQPWVSSMDPAFVHFLDHDATRSGSYTPSDVRWVPKRELMNEILPIWCAAVKTASWRHLQPAPVPLAIHLPSPQIQ